jgi:mannose/fructose/N-acetylgalactosamine-specific phosphotransferase system component IIC
VSGVTFGIIFGGVTFGIIFGGVTFGIIFGAPLRLLLLAAAP